MLFNRISSPRFLQEFPELANSLFPGNGESVELVFAELFCEEWIEFDAFYVGEIQAYLSAGEEPALAVMQFNVIKQRFYQRQLGVWRNRLVQSRGAVGDVMRRRAENNVPEFLRDKQQQQAAATSWS